MSYNKIHKVRHRAFRHPWSVCNAFYSVSLSFWFNDSMILWSLILWFFIGHRGLPLLLLVGAPLELTHDFFCTFCSSKFQPQKDIHRPFLMPKIIQHDTKMMSKWLPKCIPNSVLNAFRKYPEIRPPWTSKTVILCKRGINFHKIQRSKKVSMLTPFWMYFGALWPPF